MTHRECKLTRWSSGRRSKRRCHLPRGSPVMGARRQRQGGVQSVLCISSYSQHLCFEGGDYKVVNFIREKCPWKKILRAPMSLVGVKVSRILTRKQAYGLKAVITYLPAAEHNCPRPVLIVLCCLVTETHRA